MNRIGSTTEAPRVRVVVEVPRGSFLKRDGGGRLDFISPLPCPFNYGSVPAYIGLEGDYLDAVVIGPRLARGAEVEVFAWGAVGLTDRNLYDDKLICATRPPGAWQRSLVLRFFAFYAACKKLLNLCRGQPGRTLCEGWGHAGAAIARATPAGERTRVRPRLRY